MMDAEQAERIVVALERIASYLELLTGERGSRGYGIVDLLEALKNVSKGA